MIERVSGKVVKGGIITAYNHQPTDFFFAQMNHRPMRHRPTRKESFTIFAMQTSASGAMQRSPKTLTQKVTWDM